MRIFGRSCEPIFLSETPYTKPVLALNQVTSELFDMLSDNSEVDHPLCEECTDTLLQSMEQQLELAEQVTINDLSSRQRCKK